MRPTRRSRRLWITGSSVCALACAILLLAAGPHARAEQPAGDPASVPQAAVDALNKLSGGPHAGYRANHAKGVLLTGHFVAAKGAAALTKAAHLQPGRRSPVIVRFSNGTGVPEIPDTDPNASPHGMAIRFTLADGSSTDIVAISASTFPVARPEEFVQMLEAVAASGAGATKPTPIESFLAGHPKAAAWVQTPRPAPASFATLAFHGINAFRFSNAAGATHFVRYGIIPVAGEQALPAEQAKAAPRDYLMDEIRKRVARQPATFRLVVQVADAGDATDDGSVAWPSTRQVVDLGTLVIDGVAKDQVAAQKQLMFTPLALTDGIEPSDDPVLLVRPAAYALSYLQRAQ